MATEVASAYVSLLPSFKGGTAAISKELGGAGAAGGKVAGGRFRSAFLPAIKGLVGPVAAIFAGTKIVGFFKDAVSGATDLSETINKNRVIFGDASAVVERFARTANTSLGQTRQQALDGAATFGVFGKAAGLSGKDLAGFSTEMVSLSADLASFHNASPEEAIEAIGAALRGEAEPIRRFGVLLDDASLRNQALKMGLISTTKDALTPQQKTLAAHALIMKQTSDAQGDFARTSDGLANQQRILSAQWSDFKTTLGAALLPIITSVVTKFNEWLPSIVAIGKQVGSVLAPALQTASDYVSAFFRGLSGSTASGSGPLVDIVNAGKGVRDTFIALLPTLRTIGGILLGAFKTGFTVAKVAITGAIAAFAAIGRTISENQTTFKVIAGILTAVLIPALVRWGVTSLVSATKQAAAWVIAQAGAIAAKINYIATSAIIVARWVLMGAVALRQAARIAAAWLISMGPIGLIIAAVVALVVVVVKNWDTIKRAITTAANAVLNFLRKNWPLILAILTGPIGIAVLLIVRNWAKIKAATSAAWNAIKSAISSAWNAIKSGVSAAINAVKSFITSGWNTARSITANAWGRIKSAVSSGISAMLGFVRSIPGRITNALGNLGNLLFNAGRSIIDGLVRGIRSVIGKVTGAVSDVMQRARDLLPFSPAKEGPFSGRGWTLYSGRSIIEGLAKGIGQRSALLDRTLADTLTTPLNSRLNVPRFGAAVGSASAVGGINVQTLEVKAFSDRFSLRQVQDELAMHGVA